MKQLVVIYIFPLLFLFSQNCFSQEYFYPGQESPGKAAEIFAPDIISLSNRFAQNSTFSSSGHEFCFAVTNSGWSSCRIWYTQYQDGAWTTPVTAPFINGGGWDPFFSPDGKYFYYLRSESVGVLYRLENLNGEWQNATPLPSAISSVAGASLSATANGTLYFWSNQPQAVGGGGIYKSISTNGENQSVEKVASPINDYSDSEPFIAPDESYLIFSSRNRPGGFGQDDLYISFNSVSGWTMPVNLGPDINTNEIEFSAYISPDSKYIFFSRRKKMSTSTPSGIYWADASFIDSLRIAQAAYFRQESPGKIAKIFAQGIISQENRFDQNSTFSPSGDEFCFSVTNSAWSSCKIMYTRLVQNDWEEPEAIVTNGWDPFFSPDGKRLFYSQDGDIYSLERTEDAWGSPKRLDASINNSGMEWSPSVSENGTIYYFSRGPNCIYKARMLDGGYPSVEKVASPINDYSDSEPFIAPDESYLIFSSDNRPNGFGTSDLYISFSTGNGWSEPVNLGAGINSGEMEFSPCVSPDNKFLFFSRRKGWTTSTPSNIYWIDASFIDSLKQANITGSKADNPIPIQFGLYRNYPNPFNPTTLISFSLPQNLEIKLVVYDILGKEVATLIDSEKPAGNHRVTFDGKQFASGIYFYRLQANDQVFTKKMVLTK